MKRVAGVFALGLAPIIVLGWAGSGCSDKNTAVSGATPAVDPGGTFGAEIAINVVGRGRVTSSIPGVDCPTDCFAKYVFASAGAPGAEKGVGLKAIATPGSNFQGWSFEAEQIGSRGKGPDNCNPILRAGTTPQVNASGTEINLPFGETTGTPPKGQEGACAAYTKVPVVYKVTATFDNPVFIDAGPDGGDGGAGDIVFNAPQPNTVGNEMGFSGSYLYWKWSTLGGLHGISYSTNATTSSIPTNGNQIVSPSQTINLFEVDQYGVAYQTSSNTIYISRSGQSPQQMNGVAPTCSALSVDSSYNVYCRSTSGSLVQWTSSTGYSTPITLYTNIPSGNDLLVESSFGTAYFSTSNAISSLPLSPTPDGGIASPTTVIFSAFQPSNLEANGSHFWWIEGGDSFYASSSKSVSATRYDTTVPFGSSLLYSAPDQSSSYYWVASSSSIYKAYYAGGAGQTRLFKSGLSGIGGIAADFQYVYWTQTDGTVRRASATNF